MQLNTAALPEVKKKKCRIESQTRTLLTRTLPYLNKTALLSSVLASAVIVYLCETRS